MKRCLLPAFNLFHLWPIDTASSTEMVIPVMDRHLRGYRTLSDLVAILALFLLLSACGGGGGGVHPASGKVTRIIEQDTQETTPNDATTPAQPGDNQLTPTPESSGSRVTTEPDTGESPQQVGITALRWKAPTQRADGQSLTMSEIAGYRIYYGTHSGDYDSVLPVDDPYTFTLQIQNLPVGTYYFVMTTVDTNGLESSYSQEAARTVES